MFQLPSSGLTLSVGLWCSGAATSDFRLYGPAGEELTACAICEWLCQQSGGYYVRNPKSACEEGYEVVPATHTIVQQFAGLLDVVSRAAQDNTITPDESAEIRVVWDRLKAYCEGFVRCCEEGDFEQIQKELSGERKMLQEELEEKKEALRAGK